MITRIFVFFVSSLLSAAAATKSIVPNADGDGQLGTSNKQWLAVNAATGAFSGKLTLGGAPVATTNQAGAIASSAAASAVALIPPTTNAVNALAASAASAAVALIPPSTNAVNALADARIAASTPRVAAGTNMVAVTNGGVITLHSTATSGTNNLDTNSVIALATNGSLPSLAVSGPTNLPGSIWFRAASGTNTGTSLQGPATGSNAIIALPGTAASGYLKSTLNGNGVAVLSYDPGIGASNATLTGTTTLLGPLDSQDGMTNSGGLYLNSSLFQDSMQIAALGAVSFYGLGPIWGTNTSIGPEGNGIIGGLAATNGSLRGNISQLYGAAPDYATNTVIDLSVTNNWYLAITAPVNVRITNGMPGSWFQITINGVNTSATNYPVSVVYPPTWTTYLIGTTNTAARSNALLRIAGDIPATNSVCIFSQLSNPR